MTHVGTGLEDRAVSPSKTQPSKVSSSPSLRTAERAKQEAKSNGTDISLLPEAQCKYAPEN